MAGRFGIVLLVAGACVGLVVAADKDTRFFFTIWGIPLALAFLTAAVILLIRAPLGARIFTAALLFLAAAAPWEMIRMEGVTGTFGMDPAWRWSQSSEDRVAQLNEQADPSAFKPVDDKALAVGEGDYPGFRGADRTGRAPALKSTELVKQWDRPIGPGWGSVSGVGELIFTQEQRKDNELVTCYDLATGKLRWMHAEETRHADGPSGPGPRATPTFADGKLYTLGGTGMLLRLDAATGKPEWKKAVDVKEVLGVKNPVFGCACSPLVHKGKVYVHPGVEGPILAAFDAKTGEKLWTAGQQKNESYSSPQLATLAGVEQILVFGSTGLNSYDPATGKELWSYAWASEPTAQPSVQPSVLPGDRVLLGGAQPSTGFRCLKVSRSGGEWKTDVEWETKAVSPRFNDVVFYENHLFGLDSGRLFCLDASNGELRWKSRSSAYGSGQVMLIGKKILVLAEKGYLTWYDADVNSAPKPERVEALSDKTWNHPAVVRGRLLVRNGKELICFAPKE
jgi:outer membrane protein assembly factor BamB